MIEITWLGHGTYQMRLSSGEVVLVDPWIEGNPANIPPGTFRPRPRGHHADHARPLRSHPRRDAAGQASSRRSMVAIFETAHWLEIEGREEHDRHE
jgi:hypothetical protein